MDRPTITTFEGAVADFTRFAVERDSPPLLWAKEHDVVLALWKSRWTYFIWKGDPAEKQSLARVEYESATARNIGLAFEGKCKTDRWTLCRIYVPVDDEDAHHRMIPRTGVKVSIAVDPPPVVLVESGVLWRILKWMTRKKGPVWD
jgi:hypothetical protein